MNIKEYIKKLQALPEFKKKIIFVVVVGITVVIVGFWGVVSTKNNISHIQQAVKSGDFPKIDLSGNPGNNGPSFPNINDVVNNANATPLISPSPSSSPNPSPSPNLDNWQIYTNTQYGFEVKYPQNLVIKEKSSGNSFTSESFEDNGLHPFWISFGNSSQKDIVAMTNPKASDYSEIKNGTVTVGDVNWKTIEEINIPVEGNGTASSLLNVYTQKGNTTYISQCVNCNADVFGNDGANKKLIFDQMVSTFKFTN